MRNNASTWELSFGSQFLACKNRDAFWHQLETVAARVGDARIEPTSGRDRAYHATYEEFLRFFRERSTLTQHDLLLAAAFTYGWMPRILQIVPSEADAALKALQSARDGEEPSEAGLLAVARFLAGSVSGASKLLHFTSPERFPIWDSRVARFLGARAKVAGEQAKAEQYLAFARLCAELCRDSRSQALCSRVRAGFGSALSPFRALELVMYLGGEARTAADVD